MNQHAVSDHRPLAGSGPRFDWRDWLVFVASVFGTALLVSLTLAALVLLVQ